VTATRRDGRLMPRPDLTLTPCAPWAVPWLACPQESSLSGLFTRVETGHITQMPTQADMVGNREQDLVNAAYAIDCTR
jgi:hypothetical protein